MNNPLFKNQESRIEGGYIFRRYRYARGRKKILDAHQYGYQAWRIPIKSKKH